MNLLYHHRTQGRGAEGVHISSTVKALKNIGCNVKIIGPPGIDPLTTAGDVPIDNEKLSVSGIHRIWSYVSREFPQMGFEILELLYNIYGSIRLFYETVQRPCDGIYERYAFMLLGGFVVAKLRKIPFVLEVNEVSGVKRERKQKMLFLTAKIESLLFKKADHILVVSSFLQEKVIERGGDPVKVHLVPNGVDLNLFRPKINVVFKEQLGFDNCLVLGFLGWFSKWDRLDLLVEAFSKLCKLRKDLKLVLVGTGPMIDELHNKISIMGLDDAVYMPGGVERESVADYLSIIDIGVFPDSNEFGSPISLFELMAMGKTVVGPNLAPFLDVISDGENGKIFKRGSVDDLVSILQNLIDNPSEIEKIGKVARLWVEDKRSWESVAIKIEEMFRISNEQK